VPVQHWPFGQQDAPQQLWPLGQTLPQEPQLQGSVARLVQLGVVLPPQFAFVHLAWPAAQPVLLTVTHLLEEHTEPGAQHNSVPQQIDAVGQHWPPGQGWYPAGHGPAA
jgi:hypothetical protein